MSECVARYCGCDKCKQREQAQAELNKAAIDLAKDVVDFFRDDEVPMYKVAVNILAAAVTLGLIEEERK